jgi:hypothetical protein
LLLLSEKNNKYDFDARLLRRKLMGSNYQLQLQDFREAKNIERDKKENKRLLRP